ncbi:MAG: 5-(carboxyamino)imidazole ribonucleotide synthase [Candidatus Sumerlaeia bacterium]|nr:5-(carboxyamino)imidazole ribonucleotide synthase [Candidatus Sumerlaeia bacterium]
MRIGILGGGQLGRMLALAGVPLGYRFLFLDPSAEAPARDLGEYLCAGYDDRAGLARLADSCDVVTYEFESVPASAVHELLRRRPVRPGALALETAQERFAEKSLFQRLGIPTAPFAPVDSLLEFRDALDRIGYPAVLKTRRHGYDGKGQAVLRSAADADHAWTSHAGVPLLIEGHVPFIRELSIVGVRGADGALACYPLVENRHHAGILRLTIAPAPAVDDALQQRAEDLFALIAQALDYVGVLAVELFQTEGGLLANEIAPRVHNSGHWTIEGARTSQFENHIRAIAGLPLGDCSAFGPAAMVNLIGSTPERDAVLSILGAKLHLYGKSDRPGRKLGHVTLLADTPEDLRARLGELAAAVPGIESLL